MMAAPAQQSLFDLEPTAFELGPAAAQEPMNESGVDWEALSEIAFLYTATEKGNNSGIKFATRIEDAKKWCSSEKSKGVLHGTRWAYFWTSASHFVRRHNDFTGAQDNLKAEIDITNLKDNGEWDARLQEAGVRKIGLGEFYDLLTPLGVKVKSTLCAQSDS